MGFVKVSLIGVWIFGIASFFVGGDSTIAWLGRMTFWGILVIHTVEAIVSLKKLRDAPGSLAGNFLQVIVFGFGHLLTLGQPKQENAG